MNQNSIMEALSIANSGKIIFCKSLTEYLVVNVQVETGNIVDDFQKSWARKY